MEFALGSVPIKIVAKIYGKDPNWVRSGLITGYLPIGVATRKGERVTKLTDQNSKLGRIDYYVSPKLLYEHTGFIYSQNSQLL